MWSWMEALVRTYDTCMDLECSKRGPIPLPPICHTFRDAQVTVTIDAEGRFVSAEAVPKDSQFTRIPCTVGSEYRASVAVPHGLADELLYVVWEIPKHIKGWLDPVFYMAGELFFQQLKCWCIFDRSNAKSRAVLKYIASATFFDDLVRAGILLVDERGCLLPKAKASRSPLYTVAGLDRDQLHAFVRWAVVMPDGQVVNTWEDDDMCRSWAAFMLATRKQEGVGFAGGEAELPEPVRPGGIRPWSGVGLPFSDDWTRFPRGYADRPELAYWTGFEKSQKMNSALRWLIVRQGYRRRNYAVVAWTVDGDEVRSPAEEMHDILRIGDEGPVTDREAAELIRARIREHFSGILGKEVMVLAVHSPRVGDGRITIKMFRQVPGEELVRHMEDWNLGCAWVHDHAKVTDADGRTRRFRFVGAPSPDDIAKALYGWRTDDGVTARLVERILPCIVDGEDVP